MTRMKLVVALSLVLLSPVTAFAACGDGFVLKRIGEAKADDANIVTSGADVSAILVDCGSSACTAGFYDADTVQASVVAVLVAHVGAAANGVVFLDLTDSPLYFSDGISFIDDANVDATVVYSCQPR